MTLTAEADFVMLNPLYGPIERLQWGLAVMEEMLNETLNESCWGLAYV